MARLVLLFLFLTPGWGLIMPITKPDGSLDVSSLLTHISLLEQTFESKASTSELSDLKSQLQTALADLKQAQVDIKATQTVLQTTQAELLTVQNDSKHAQLELKVTQTEQKTIQAQLLTTQNDLKTVQTYLAHTQLDLAHAQTEIVQLKKTQDETKDDLKSTQTKVVLMESQLNSANVYCTCNTTATQSMKDIPSIKTDISALKTDVFHLQSQRNVSEQAGNMTKGGAHFTRWGRTTCPDDTKIVYQGHTGGTHFSYRASSATILCLPDHPIYAVHATPVKGYESYIYGTEYETEYNGNPFRHLHDEDMPCVVCDSKTKISAIMVPARNQCYPGWTLEYWSYLMGGEIAYASSEYICVDKDAEAFPGGEKSNDQNVLNIVSSVCGSLPCPPYENKWQLTCAVCSK